MGDLPSSVATTRTDTGLAEQTPTLESELRKDIQRARESLDNFDERESLLKRLLQVAGTGALRTRR